LLGQVAAVVLHPTCKWLDVTARDASLDVGQKMPGPAARVTIAAENRVHDKPPRLATFRFERHAADSPWVLESLDFTLSPGWRAPSGAAKY
jgi:hypothetical protein